METSRIGKDASLPVTLPVSLSPRQAEESASSPPQDRLDLSDKDGSLARKYRDSRNVYSEEMNYLKKYEVRKPGRDVFGVGAGLIGGVASQAAGVETFFHESAHKAVIQKMYEGASAEIQIDSFENIGDYLKDPSPSNFTRVMTMYDAHEDGAAGYTAYDYGKGPSEVGRKLGPETRNALISAAGCVATEIPALAGFAAGFKLRRSHPVLGYALMTVSTVTHLNNSLYVGSALSPSMAAMPGHDWASFAKSTGINPVLTTVAFAASLPTLGVAMYLVDRHNEEKAKDRLAITRLVAGGDVKLEELNQALGDYRNADKLQSAGDRLEEIMKNTSGNQDEKSCEKELRKASGSLQKEYNRFSDFLADRFRDRVEKEKMLLPEQGEMSVKECLSFMKQDLRESWEKDKVGTALSVGSKVGVAALVGNSAVGILKQVAPAAVPVLGGVAGKVLGAVVPGAGLVMGANSIYNAGKAIKDPNLPAFDKAMAVSSAAFSSIGAASMLVPGLGIPLAIVSIGGLIGTEAVKWIGHKVKGE
ncbi:MAG: hypothetical protein V2A78_06985 [bacterium]